MRQRCQVARGTHRALGWDARIDLGVIELDQCFNHFPADPGKTTGQRTDLQRHDQADAGIVEQRPGAGAVGEQQVALQLGQRLGGNRGPGEQAEAGIDAVHRALVGDDLVHRAGAGVDVFTGGRVQFDRALLLIDGAQLIQGELTGLERQRCGHGSVLRRRVGGIGSYMFLYIQDEQYAGQNAYSTPRVALQTRFPSFSKKRQRPLNVECVTKDRTKTAPAAHCWGDLKPMVVGFCAAQGF